MPNTSCPIQSTGYNSVAASSNAVILGRIFFLVETFLNKLFEKAAFARNVIYQSTKP